MYNSHDKLTYLKGNNEKQCWVNIGIIQRIRDSLHPFKYKKREAINEIFETKINYNNNNEDGSEVKIKGKRIQETGGGGEEAGWTV